jgi:hypothetical protein
MGMPSFSNLQQHPENLWFSVTSDPQLSRTPFESSTTAPNVIPSKRAVIGGEQMEFTSLEEKVDFLAQVWREFSCGRSVIDYNHAAYMQIIGIGPQAMPILMRRLRAGESDWIIAMKYITGERVTTPEMRGNFRAIRDAWLKWGEENGIGRELR